MLDLQKMRQIVEGLHLAGVEQAFGQIGIESFNKVVETVSELYQRFDPALRERRLLVYAATDVQSASVVLAGATVLRLDSIGHEFAGADSIQVLYNGILALLADAAADAIALSQLGVVYSFAGGVELIYAKGERFRLVNP